MKALVTGGAGFIGSNLVDRLALTAESVVVYDNFVTGKEHFLQNVYKKKNFKLIKADLLNLGELNRACENIDIVFHLAANADVRYGPERPTIDLEQNTIVTSNVLEAVREQGVKKVVFSSTGSIYGDTKEIPTPEDAKFPIQTSLYGASKLACEGLICSYAEAYNIQSYIFRFVSILGMRYTHGHVYDFYKKIKVNKNELEVLGDGTQKKSYLHVSDCIDAMMFCLEKANEKINIYNLGTNEFISVNDSVNIICNYLKVKPRIKYSGGNRGWVGDNPFIWLDCSKIYELGIKPRYGIEESVVKTLKWLDENEWVF